MRSNDILLRIFIFVKQNMNVVL